MGINTYSILIILSIYIHYVIDASGVVTERSASCLQLEMGSTSPGIRMTFSQEKVICGAEGPRSFKAEFLSEIPLKLRDCPIGVPYGIKFELIFNPNKPNHEVRSLFQRKVGSRSQNLSRAHAVSSRRVTDFASHSSKSRAGTSRSQRGVVTPFAEHGSKKPRQRNTDETRRCHAFCTVAGRPFCAALPPRHKAPAGKRRPRLDLGAGFPPHPQPATASVPWRPAPRPHFCPMRRIFCLSRRLQCRGEGSK